MKSRKVINDAFASAVSGLLQQTVSSRPGQGLEPAVSIELVENPLHVVPNGVEDEFFETTPTPKTDWVICTATIHPRKRVLELAEAAVQARVPVWISLALL